MRAPRPSACPGLFRIVPAKDGGLCRLKVPLGRLAAAGARAVAEAASQYGNSIVEVTNRANLQLRGIRDGAAASLARDLLAAGLGPTHPESDDVRNVMISPMAGLDPQQHLDVSPIAAEILRHLETDEACRVLSPKFSVLVDGAEAVAVADHPHDLWLAAMDSEAFAIGIAGCPPLAAEDMTSFLAVAAADAARAVSTALALFLDEAAGDAEISRFRHLLGRLSRDAFLQRLSKRLGVPANLGDKARRWRRRMPVTIGHIGIRGQRQAGLVAIGAVPPLGRLSPEALTGLGDLAAEHGGSLRLTPWQSVMVADVRQEKAGDVIGALEDLGLICTPAHPLATIIACAGSTGCAKGRADTKGDAMRFADVERRGFLHLSGCERSCASAGIADTTLLASSPGVYDLFVKDPRTADRFGRAVAGGLTVEQARRQVRQSR